MSNNRNFDGMDNPSLAALCKQETDKFFKKLVSDSRYCFELLCRAFRDRAEDALTHVYNIYIPILYNRAKKHKAFHQSSQDALSFSRIALANYYHSVQGDRFLEMFSSLPQAMAYLYVCLSSEIFMDIRRHRHETKLEDNPQSSPQSTDLEYKELLKHIYQLLPKENDRLLFKLRFLLDMKPSEIAERYPEIWNSSRQATIHLYHLREKLRENLDLNRLMS